MAHKLPKLDIVYQTDEILVVNKPCGMSTQGGRGAGITLEEVLQHQLGQSGKREVYLVHRLDRDTSGLMIVARSSAAAAKWASLIKSRQVQKEYMALCIGLPRLMQGTIKTPIDGAPAKTRYEVLGAGQTEINNAQMGGGGGCLTLSLIRARLVTGRKHQIRIHLASIGYPIAGDDKHGNFALNRTLRKECSLRALCLASVKLTLPCFDGVPPLRYENTNSSSTFQPCLTPPFRQAVGEFIESAHSPALSTCQSSLGQYKKGCRDDKEYAVQYGVEYSEPMQKSCMGTVTLTAPLPKHITQLMMRANIDILGA